MRELRVGWREFTSRSRVWVIVVAFCFLNAGITASLTVLGPAVADTTGIGRTGWGPALAACSLGAVAGGVLSLSRRPRRAILVGCALMSLTATTPLLLAPAPYTWVLVVADFVAGVGVEQAGVAWYSTLDEQIPEDRLARVYAYDNLGSYLALPLARFTAGPAVLLLGLHATVYAAAALILLATLVMVATPSVLHQPVQHQGGGGPAPRDSRADQSTDRRAPHHRSAAAPVSVSVLPLIHSGAAGERGEPSTGAPRESCLTGAAPLGYATSCI